MPDIYEQLLTKLSQHPIAVPIVPGSITGWVDFLKGIFTHEEAEIVLQLTTELETVDQISERTGIAKEKLTEVLTRCAKKSGIFMDGRDGVPRYSFHAIYPGILEGQAGSIDEAVARHVDNIYPEIARTIAVSTVIGIVGSVLPAEKAIAKTGIQPKYSAAAMLKESETIGLATCICREIAGKVGRACGRPTDVCLHLTPLAEFYIHTGTAKKLTFQEAIETLERAEDAGLVHLTAPGMSICSCCTCCCNGLRAYSDEFGGDPSKAFFSEFIASVDEELCNGCEACISVCPLSVISMQDEKAVIGDRCIGCGLCVKDCPIDALMFAASETDLEPGKAAYDKKRDSSK